MAFAEQAAAEFPTMTTYKRADGELIFGEYSFTTHTDGLDEEAAAADDPVEYVEEVWVRRSVRSFKLPTCAECDEPATHWGLCETHAREDDPDSFAEVVASREAEQGRTE